jgi:transketolase
MNWHLPKDWNATLKAFKKENAENPTAKPGIAASGDVLSLLADAIPEIMSGAPDLEAATKHKRQLTPFTKDDRSGRYIHYGVREHAMGAIMNGMTVHRGVMSVGTTFLVFSDYMRHTLRMAALMGIPGLFVFSHDSIGIGKNGPTHQPVESLASLRAFPNMWVFRPADPVEMAECWELGIQHQDGPTTIICSRQPLPPVRTVHTDENLCARGAYILADAEGGPRQGTIFATGYEVSIAMDARKILQEKSIPTAVVSMPSWELFEQQDEDYRDTIIGRDTARVAVEAAVRLGWDRYIGEKGKFIGMSSFGASGDMEDVFKHFGITPEAVAEAVQSLLG